MKRQETSIIENFCTGNSKSLPNIEPFGLNFDLPIGRFVSVLRIALMPYGFTYSENNSDENQKIFVNAQANSVVMVTIDDNQIKEVIRMIAYDNLERQLTDLKKIINEVIEKYGSPHDWMLNDADVVACSWEAQNLNCLTVGFSRSANEIQIKYMKNHYW